MEAEKRNQKTAVVYLLTALIIEVPGRREDEVNSPHLLSCGNIYGCINGARCPESGEKKGRLNERLGNPVGHHIILTHPWPIFS